jgi:ketosteroid isomerase-like protein
VSEESTTPDLLELGQRLTDALNARDIDAAISLYAPDAVFDMATFGIYEGRAAIRGLFEDWLSAYDDFGYEIEERRNLGGGVTFIVWVQRGRLRGSTSWVQFRAASVGTWVDGLVERSTQYQDIDQARAAAERLAKERGG